MSIRSPTSSLILISILNIVFGHDKTNTKNSIDIDPSLYESATNKNDTVLIIKLFETIQNEIFPLTQKQVRKGDRVFGGGVFLNSLEDNYPLIMIGTNRAFTKNPLFHGEISTINNYHNSWNQDATLHNYLDFSFNKEYEGDEPAVEDTIFLATHEPCSYCLSAISWNGFKNFYYLFTYEETQNDFEMPGDILMMEQVFNNYGTEQDPYYNEQNTFWLSRYIVDVIQETENEQVKKILMDKYLEIKAQYTSLMDIHPDSGKELHFHGQQHLHRHEEHSVGNAMNGMVNVDKIRQSLTHHDRHGYDNNATLVMAILSAMIVIAGAMFCCIMGYICCGTNKQK
eukprot:510779_1